MNQREIARQRNVTTKCAAPTCSHAPLTTGSTLHQSVQCVTHRCVVCARRRQYSGPRFWSHCTVTLCDPSLHQQTIASEIDDNTLTPIRIMDQDNTKKKENQWGLVCCWESANHPADASAARALPRLLLRTREPFLRTRFVLTSARAAVSPVAE